jgi:hypothetical protein
MSEVVGCKSRTDGLSVWCLSCTYDDQLDCCQKWRAKNNYQIMYGVR